jgi:hypothetical protein
MGYLHLKDEPTQVYSYPLNEAPADLDPRLEFSEGDVTLLFDAKAGWANVQLPAKPTGAQIIEALKPLVDANLQLLAPYVAQWAIVVTALQIDAFAIALSTLNSVDTGGNAQVEALKAVIEAEINKGL